MQLYLYLKYGVSWLKYCQKKCYRQSILSFFAIFLVLILCVLWLLLDNNQHLNENILLRRIIHGYEKISTIQLNNSNFEQESQIRKILNKINKYLSAEGVNCETILTDNLNSEVDKAIKLSKNLSTPLDYQKDVYFGSLSCDQIKQTLVTEPTDLEHFSIAFSLSVFKDFYQVEKLFRAIYRPYHFYCIHVDTKSTAHFFKAVKNYAGCFDNVYFPDKFVNMEWGKFSILEAELQCFKKLLSKSKVWKYLINLTGQEYPLRTLTELQKILKVMNGSNNLERSNWDYEGHPLTQYNLSNLMFTKGSIHATLSRGFVEFMFQDPRSLLIIDYLRNPQSSGGSGRRSFVPDESFLSTLNYNADILKIPGAYTGNWTATDNINLPFFNRYKNWILKGPFGYPCLSHVIVRQICIWGIADLAAMNKRFEFFVNKFYWHQERFALQCMEYRFWRNSLADLTSAVSKTHVIPLSFYSSFDFVQNHI